MTNHGLTVDDADRLLDKIINIPERNSAFERLRPITDFRKDDSEARILYICRRVQPKNEGANDDKTSPGKDELFVLKCKIQAPSVLAGGLTTPIEGPSEYTKDELKALEVFSETNSPGLPHLVATKTVVQDERGPLPGGYLAYVVMTLMPGKDVFDLKFWSMSDTEKEKIRDEFVVALKRVWRLGFEPYDCALRNILWDAETGTLSLVDFEHWRPTAKDPINMTEREEMQRWGLLHRPPPREHWQEWVYNGTF
ncbi:unnamed protein product [Zymoseptoria tritici ST99CH_1E4]|uniref:Aminoglycoside phosphotransferase domain-containing protein n=1 Tax=Zymoseptoria tritici ST99CH_1E4 TaxID=1276532 RepID=A0A2H1GJ19_ZYMTR|nr:unnamed protein product [Zymoseptoria tritici ST99CH_1E4]